MKIGVVLLNFGEPEDARMETVVPFLERIFSFNAPLRGGAGTAAEVQRRCRALAESRAPALIEEYREIGGSPLQRQALEQAEALEAELVGRGLDAVVSLGMQFTEPSIGTAVKQARDAGVEYLLGLPVYPLCGPSTSVAALHELDGEMEWRGWKIPTAQVSGWHRHPGYLRLRVNAIRRVLDEHGLDLADPETRLVFSAHGTPLSYLENGSRYDDYVREFCARAARELGSPDYLVGYQNHTDRPGVAWTQPDVETVINGLEGKRVVVDAVSFMHEQSETLADLDRELRGVAESRGLEFHRVPIPHADPAFIQVLAELVEQAVLPAQGVGVRPAAEERLLVHCHCKPTAGTVCTNGGC